MKTTLFILRHGETKYNAQKRVQGRLPIPLNAKGKKQAKELGKLMEKIPIEIVFSSPLKRTLQTATIVFPNQKIHLEDDLQERNYGKLDGHLWEEVYRLFPRAMADYKKNRSLNMKGTESIEKCRSRAKRVLHKILAKNKGKTIAIVGHGMFNKALLAELLGWSNEELAHAHQHNASVNELVLDGKKWKMVRGNETKHLSTPTLPIKKIEKAVKAWEAKMDFKSHDYLHIKRVAQGAQWFAQQLELAEYDQQLAYLAGLVHDLGRPKTEKIDHTQRSVQLAQKVLQPFSLNISEHNKVLALVESHRLGKTDLSDQVVFLADKLWEQTGAYAVFRRAIFVTEIADYKKKDFREAMILQSEKRMKRFAPKIFPKQFQKLASYQFQWQTKALRALKKNEPWIMELLVHCRKNATKKGKTIDAIIKRFKPSFKEGKRFQQEATLYITCGLIGCFEKKNQKPWLKKRGLPNNNYDIIPCETPR